jgi:hypothetical protein
MNQGMLPGLSPNALPFRTPIIVYDKRIEGSDPHDIEIDLLKIVPASILNQYRNVHMKISALISAPTNSNDVIKIVINDDTAANYRNEVFWRQISPSPTTGGSVSNDAYGILGWANYQGVPLGWSFCAYDVFMNNILHPDDANKGGKKTFQFYGQQPHTYSNGMYLYDGMVHYTPPAGKERLTKFRIFPTSVNFMAPGSNITVILT